MLGPAESLGERRRKIDFRVDSSFHRFLELRRMRRREKYDRGTVSPGAPAVEGAEVGHRGMRVEDISGAPIHVAHRALGLFVGMGASEEIATKLLEGAPVEP